MTNMSFGLATQSSYSRSFLPKANHVQRICGRLASRCHVRLNPTGRHSQRLLTMDSVVRYRSHA